MIRTLLPAALAAALVSAAVTAATGPAFAVSIKHTNRAEGDPDTAVAPRAASRAVPPSDVSGTHYFDKSHEDNSHG